MKLEPGGRYEVFPDPPGLIEFISYVKQTDLAEVQSDFAAEFHREYIAYGKECVYNVDETGIFYDMPPRYICAVRGGSSKISRGEKHSLRMTAVLTVRADGTKLPILFIIKGVSGGRIDSGELSPFPPGQLYAVQEDAWMDKRVWATYLRDVLGEAIEEPSVVLLDNFESHVSGESYNIMYEEIGAHLCALPSNATSVCQPLDVGVMAPFKRNLRNLWLLEDIIVGDDDHPFSLTSRQKRMALVK
ncbi:hypothetical protein DYB26_016419, partial [Aphanomyces astaci]